MDSLSLSHYNRIQYFQQHERQRSIQDKAIRIMRSIGMGANQLYKMIAAESLTYAMLGCVVGCILGLPLNKMMFQFLIAEKWGTGWQVPVTSLLLIVLLCFASAAIAIRRPIKQISKMAIVDTIKLQQ